MPGTLAKDFEDAGGSRVRMMGKPDCIAYDAAIEILREADRRRVLAIGDSLGHDILGAANAGIASLYVHTVVYDLTYNRPRTLDSDFDTFRLLVRGMHWCVDILLVVSMRNISTSTPRTGLRVRIVPGSGARPFSTICKTRRRHSSESGNQHISVRFSDGKDLSGKSTSAPIS